MLILGLIFFSAITAFVTLSCSSGSDSSMAGLILMSGENNGTPTPTPAPVPTPEPNEPKPEPAPDPEPEPTPTPAPNDPVIDESTINWDKTITLNTNCISVNDVNLIFQTTSIPDDSSKSVVFDGTLHISYNKTVKRVDTSTFTLPFNSYSDATPKGYQLKINLKQIFADAVFVSGDVVKISLKDVSMKTENVKFIQMVIVDSSEVAGWYKYLSATHEENIWTLPENQPELEPAPDPEPKPEPAPDPEPEPTPTPEPNEPEPTPDPNPTYVKVAELTRNDYDTSHDAQKEICGIQAKIPLRKALSDFPGMQVNDTYTVTLTGKASREFTAQILFFDDTESGNYSGLSKWGENVTFGTSFSITKDIVLEKLPTSTAVSSKAWDVEKSFSLMIDVPAGVSATADIPPATLSFTEFKVEKKSGGVITNWTLVNDFNSTALAEGWAKADWSNNDMFDCWWDPENITFNESGNGLMKMKISANTNQNHKRDDGYGPVFEYNGAELRTTGTYGYGYYEVRMKPCKASGTNSSFFLYTRDDGNNIEWNEVDIEFITKDMGDGRGLRSIPQFNFFIDNAGEGHELLYTDLEFDASTAFHVYGIEYAADHISWYVDGTKVYTATGCEKDGHNHAQGSLPRRNMQIMVNFWPGRNTSGTNITDWLGEFHYSAPLYAEYDYIKFKAAE